MTTRAPVVVTSRSFGQGADDSTGELASHGLEVVHAPADHDPTALAPLLHDAVAWIAGAGAVTDEHLRLAPALQIVARYGTGVDAVDLDAARARGVIVTNTPGANADAVAEHAIALMLACLRRLVEADRQVRDGAWPSMRGRELGTLTVGLLGFGQVGRRVASLAAGFGSTVLVHDPFVDTVGDMAAGPEPAVTLVGQDTLLERSDVISLHRPPGRVPLIDASTLSRVRPDAILINTARAALLDEDAVAAALHDGRLGALGADVIAGRPPGPAPLLEAPRTVLTPHCAGQTEQAIDRMGRVAVAEVIRVVVHGEVPQHAVG